MKKKTSADKIVAALKRSKIPLSVSEVEDRANVSIPSKSIRSYLYRSNRVTRKRYTVGNRKIWKFRAA